MEGRPVPNTDLHDADVAQRRGGLHTEVWYTSNASDPSGRQREIKRPRRHSSVTVLTLHASCRSPQCDIYKKKLTKSGFSPYSDRAQLASGEKQGDENKLVYFFITLFCTVFTHNTFLLPGGVLSRGFFFRLAFCPVPFYAVAFFSGGVFFPVAFYTNTGLPESRLLWG